MHCTIDTGVHVIRRDETREERNAIGPAIVVEEVRPHGLRWLKVRCGSSKASHHDHKKTANRHNDFVVEESVHVLLL